MTSQDKASEEDLESVRRLIPGFNMLDILPPLSPEWYAQFIHGDLKGITPFKGGTFEKMFDFVLKGTGVTVEEFDRESGRSLRKLHAEMEREVNLARATNGNIIRFASNARTEIHAPLQNLSLQEIGRVLLESGKEIVHPTPRRHASSETMLRRMKVSHGAIVEESPEVTAQRGIKEEYGMEIEREHLFPLVLGAPIVPPPYPSTVYTCSRVPIKSVVATWPFRLDFYSTFEFENQCPKIIRDGDILTVQDDDVLLKLKWLQPQN